MTERGLVRTFGERLKGTCIVYLFGDNGVPARVETIVDTGFDGYLTLVGSVINDLGLEATSSIRMVLADGSDLMCLVFRVGIDWHGQSRTIEVVQLEGPQLLGMEMLRGCELRMKVVDAVVIEITALE